MIQDKVFLSSKSVNRLDGFCFCFRNTVYRCQRFSLPYSMFKHSLIYELYEDVIFESSYIYSFVRLEIHLYSFNIV